MKEILQGLIGLLVLFILLSSGSGGTRTHGVPSRRG